MRHYLSNPKSDRRPIERLVMPIDLVLQAAGADAPTVADLIRNDRLNRGHRGISAEEAPAQSADLPSALVRDEGQRRAGSKRIYAETMTFPKACGRTGSPTPPLVRKPDQVHDFDVATAVISVNTTGRIRKANTENA